MVTPRCAVFLLAFGILFGSVFGSKNQWRNRELPPGSSVGTVPGYPDRPYLLHLPQSRNDARLVPLILVLHGAGYGGAVEMDKITCPGGRLGDPGCLDEVAGREGFAVVYPTGTPEPSHPGMRTFNAGGGRNGYTCQSGYACQSQVDEEAYFNALLDELERAYRFDEKRIFATGLSNGAALTHRLACTMADRITAIAPVAAGNQFSTCEKCAPARAISILEFHGDADPVNPYQGGFKKTIGSSGKEISIADTFSGWASRDGCSQSPMKESMAGGIVRERYAPCRDHSQVVLYTIQNGGHTWPGGFQYLPRFLIGETTDRLNANELIVEFFEKHPKEEYGSR